jgi:hypothetical protein
MLKHCAVHFKAKYKFCPRLYILRHRYLKTRRPVQFAVVTFRFSIKNPLNSVIFCYQVTSNIYKSLLQSCAPAPFTNTVKRNLSTIVPQLFLKISRKFHTTFAPRRFASEIHVTSVLFVTTVMFAVTCAQGTQNKLGLNSDSTIMANTHYEHCTTFS